MNVPRGFMSDENDVNEERFRIIANVSNDGLYDWNVVTNEIWGNEAYLKQFSIPEPVDVESNWEANLHPDDRETVLRLWQEKMDGSELEWEFEYRYKTTDGEYHWLNDRAQLIRDSTGKVVRVLGAIRDITERKQAAKQRVQLEIERERMRVLTNFIEKASHEFRTPLSIIQTNLYLLNMTLTQETEKHRLGTIGEQVNSITRLVDDLFQMLKVESHFDFAQDQVHIAEILKEIGLMEQPKCDEHEIAFHLTIENDLPILLGDSALLRLAITKIVSNAIRYTPKFGAVTIKAYTENDSVVIEVQDTGIGMSPEQLDQIFERFYRVDEAHSTRGFGLGLPIAQKIVENHQGYIEVKSKLELGSEFKIVLPILSKID